MPTLHVVVPFYNEKATLVSSVERVLEAPLPNGWSARLVLVDDHCDAACQDVAQSLADDLDTRGLSFVMRHHDSNRGTVNNYDNDNHDSRTVKNPHRRIGRLGRRFAASRSIRCDTRCTTRPGAVSDIWR